MSIGAAPRMPTRMWVAVYLTLTVTAQACAPTAGPVAPAIAERQPANAAQEVVFQTSVVPQPDEDLAAPCRYEITLTSPSESVQGVWVIFERSRDMLLYYRDADVRTFARRHGLALLFPFHCQSKSPESGGDMNVDPPRGIGRALFSALSQLAQASSHPELASAKLILLGFSGTGSLVGRLAQYAPTRVLAVIATDPGHFDPLGVDTISLSPTAAAVPQLILAGSSDAVSGTQRPYAYFRRYSRSGCPLDLCRPEQGAALLHHERQGPASRVAGRRCGSRGDTNRRVIWLHRDEAERSDRLPGSIVSARSSLLVSQHTRHMGRIELVGHQSSNRAASQSAPRNDAGRLAAYGRLCEAVDLVRDTA